MRPGELDPVWLGTEGGDRLSLRVAGYQFGPTEGVDNYDLNWLRIQGRVEWSKGRFKFNDPCLQTSEVEELIDWLRQLPTSASPLNKFIEPLLEFDVDPTRCWLLKICLRGEACPDTSIDREQQWGNGVTLSVETSPAQRDQFLESLTGDFKRFPPRL